MWAAHCPSERQSMEEFDKMVRTATGYIAQYDGAKATIAESSDYGEIENAHDFLSSFQEIVSVLQDQFLLMMSQLEQLEAKAEGAGPTISDELKGRIRQAEALMRKFVEMSRADASRPLSRRSQAKFLANLFRRSWWHTNT
jgi:hypothetical protein